MCILSEFPTLLLDCNAFCLFAYYTNLLYCALFFLVLFPSPSFVDFYCRKTSSYDATYDL